MAKCSFCHSRKGKRKCPSQNSMICSPCCGENRTEEKCGSCSYFADNLAARNYKKVPYYSTQIMADNHDLQDISYSIESSICSIYHSERDTFNDRNAQKIYELFFDVHYFGDNKVIIENMSMKNAFEKFSTDMNQDMARHTKEEVINVMGAAYRSLLRRTSGGTEYLRFIEEYVGVRMGKGIRALRSIPGAGL